MIPTIRKQLRELAWLDQQRAVFGASMHQYQSNPVHPKEIKHLEDKLGICLPTDYCQFLTEIGWGAGPYYGLYGPRTVLQELEWLISDYSDETGKVIQPCSAFPFDRSTLVSGSTFVTLPLENEWPCPGCIPICHQGCTYWSVLVTSGASVGTVWDVANFVGFDGDWIPARRASGAWELGMPDPIVLPELAKPPMFLDWITGWLERCYIDLEAVR